MPLDGVQQDSISSSMPIAISFPLEVKQDEKREGECKSDGESCQSKKKNLSVKVEKKDKKWQVTYSLKIAQGKKCGI